MILHPTPLAGVLIVEPEPAEDERGSFARTFDATLFTQHGLMDRIAQSSVSRNRRAGTLRGLHLQTAPHAEAKLVRCTRGAIFDVAADLRPGSPTFGQWVSANLTANNGLGFHVPEGCAHGFQTLADDTDVTYDISVSYAPEAARGVRWDDPDLAIAWPAAGERVVSERDADLPALADFAA